MRLSSAFLFALGVLQGAHASPYREDLTDYNLNMNKNAQNPTEYQTERSNTTYTPSPDNWRALPTYTILMDKFADGDPANNDYFKSMYEQDYRETQLRFGGDLKGLVSKLDYIKGMGVKVIFMSGTPWINMLWQADSSFFTALALAYPLIITHSGYSALDFTVLDPHWGTLKDWRDAIDAIHAHGMYFMADFTVGTMGDLLGFKGSALPQLLRPVKLTPLL